jgi:hypothetical protein
MEDGGHDQRERPGVQRFGPLRTFTDAHRLAIETADSSFRVFARLLDGDDDGQPHNGTAHAATNGASEPLDGDGLGFAELRRAITRSLDLYLDLAERMFDTSTRSLEDALRLRGVTVTSGQRLPRWTPLQMEAAPGDRASGLIWLHNRTEAAISRVSLRATDLSAHNGEVIRASTIVVTPAGAEAVTPEGSVSATVTVDVPDHASAGLYVGYVLASPETEAVLPLHLRVSRAQPPD